MGRLVVFVATVVRATLQNHGNILYSKMVCWQRVRVRKDNVTVLPYEPPDELHRVDSEHSVRTQ